MARHAGAQKQRQLLRRLRAIHPVKVELAFHDPVSASQLAQDLARQAMTQKRQLFARIKQVVE